MKEQLAIDGGKPVRAGKPIRMRKVCWDEREQQAIQRVFESGIFCSAAAAATEVKALEIEFAQYVEARHAVAFSSGTTAQHAALVALGIGAGDEVIVPSLTFISTPYTVLLANAVPVFADVRRETITIDPEDIRKKITPRTKAIAPVHWLGHPADINAIMAIADELDLMVIEDCCHGPTIKQNGRQVGSFGQIACWSMQQSKVFTSAGEGGLATTNDDALAARLRQVRGHGKAQDDQSPADPSRFVKSYRVTALGNNYRLSEMQAAFARAQLSKLDDLSARRRDAYRALRRGLSDIEGLEFQAQQPGAELAYSYYPVIFPQETFAVSVEQLYTAIYAEGVETMPMGVDELSHTHPLFADPSGRATAIAYELRGDAPLPRYGRGTLPVSEKLADELLLLPMHPDLAGTEIEEIILAVRKVAAAYRQ
jgi:dTDP-4-amino-4,6-dideoxygalactose transaminase